jgi:hypothetical protein
MNLTLMVRWRRVERSVGERGSQHWFQNSLLPSSSGTMSYEGRKGKCLGEVSITSPTGRFSICKAVVNLDAKLPVSHRYTCPTGADASRIRQFRSTESLETRLSWVL